jgi:hypothetical protein
LEKEAIVGKHSNLMIHAVAHWLELINTEGSGIESAVSHRMKPNNT